MKKQTKKQKRRVFIQFVEYMVAGGAYFWTGYLIFFVCDTYLGFSLWWAKQTANVCGWTVNFILQRYWVFRNPKLKGHFGEVSVRYGIITIVDFIMDYFIIYWLKSVGVSPYIGQFVSAGFFTVWNYFWYRFWVFPTRLPAPRHPELRHVRSKRRKK